MIAQLTDAAVIIAAVSRLVERRASGERIRRQDSEFARAGSQIGRDMVTEIDRWSQVEN